LFQPLAREGKIIRAYTAGMGWVEKKVGSNFGSGFWKNFFFRSVADFGSKKWPSFGFWVTGNPTYPWKPDPSL